MAVHRRLFVVLLGIWSWSACATPSAAPAPLECTLAILKTGPRTEPLSAEERSKIFGGHFANMERLARERQLLVAGPYGQQRSDKTLRGLFVLDTPDAARAKELAETDPGFLAGVFRFEFHALSTAAALRAQLAADLAAQDAVAASGRQPEPGEGGRGYVWLTARNGDAAASALAGHPAVLLFARLDRDGAFVLLDAKDLADATTKLAPIAPQLGEHWLDEWFGSGLLVDLPRRR